MRDGWIITNLVDCLETIIDYRGKTPEKSETGIKTLSAKSVKMGEIDYNQAYHISPATYQKFMIRGFPLKGDILMTTEAPLGCIAKLDRNGVSVAQRLLTLRGKKNILDNDYLMYYLMSRIGQYELQSRATGTTVLGIKKAEFNHVLITLPPYNIQLKISIILSSIDKKIKILKQQNKTLENMAQTLFKHWFVDFEFPDENGNPYKSSGGAMEASELGEIPKGWKVGTLDDYIQIMGGGTPSTSEPLYWDDGNINWYSPTDLTKSNSLFSMGSSKKITDLGLKKSSAKLFPAYSLLMTSRATVGEITINLNEASTNQGFITLLPSDNISVYFLYDWLKTKLRTVRNLASGSTFPEISKSVFREIDFLFSTSVIMEKYNEKIFPIFRKIEINHKQIQTLTNLRDTLLPKLMSGEIEVK